MSKRDSFRALVVCGGNTCRSPVLALLLKSELHRRDLHAVLVFSAGANKHLANDTGHKGPINKFAKIALRETLTATNPNRCEQLMHEAESHTSKGLSRLPIKEFDLIVLVDRRYELALRRKHIVSSTSPITRYIGDKAFGVLQREREKDGSGNALSDDAAKRVLQAYRKQTRLLLRHASAIALRIVSWQ